MAWLPDGEKNLDDTFIRFDTTHERDRRTDRQTPHDDIGRACIASRGKNQAAARLVDQKLTPVKLKT